MEFQMRKTVGFSIIYCLLFIICGTDGCTFPSSLTGTWYSSNGGTLGFTSTTFSNFKIAAFGSFTFTCHLSSGSQYVSVSEEFYVFNLPFVAYICMDMTAHSGSKYSYYQPTSQLKDAEYARMKIYLNNTVTVSSTSDICELSDNSVLTRHMLVKDGTISSQKIQCPDPFLGKFSYTYDTGSGNLCTQNTSLDACTDNTLMNFDYNECSEIQAYSVGGQVNCLYYSTSGSISYLHVFNLDATTDESTYFRFTCYAIETIDSVVYATQYPQDCHYGQNATSVNATGASLVLTSSSTCVPDEDTTASASIGLIIGIVLLLLIILLIIFFLLFMYKKKKEKERRKKEEEERMLQERTIQEKIEHPDLRPEMDLGLPDDSKYNIDRLMYSDDKMVTPSNVEIERLRSQGFEGFDDFDEDYLDEYTRQNMIDASVFLDRRQRLDPIDEFGEKENDTFMKRFKDLARSRLKRKKKKGGNSKSKKKKGKKGKDGGQGGKKKKRLVLDLGTIDADDWESDDEGADDGDEDEENMNLPGQIEYTDDPRPPKTTIGPVLSQRNILAERRVAELPEGKRGKKKKKKKISSKIDSFNHSRRRKSSRVEDSGNREEDESTPEDIDTPRLILPLLRQGETDEDNDTKKKKKGGSLNIPSPGRKMSTMSSLRSFRSMRRAKVNNWTGHEDLDLPLYFEDPKLKDLPPLQRVNRKKNPQLWSEILEKYGGDLNLPNDPHKLRWSENKWRNLLEELYTDKRYFDYMTKSAKHNPAERDVVAEAKEGLGYLQQRANFWKNQEPIPGRPSSYRPRSFVHSATSTRIKTPKKSKSFIDSTSVKSNGRLSSKENSTLASPDMPLTSGETSKLSREKSKLSREKSMLSKENSILENSMLSREKSRSKPSREKSFAGKDSPNDNLPTDRSPYDINTNSTNTPRPRKLHLPRMDTADTIYKMDLLPKTPLTQKGAPKNLDVISYATQFLVLHSKKKKQKLKNKPRSSAQKIGGWYVMSSAKKKREEPEDDENKAPSWKEILDNNMNTNDVYSQYARFPRNTVLPSLQTRKHRETELQDKCSIPIGVIKIKIHQHGKTSVNKEISKQNIELKHGRHELHTKPGVGSGVPDSFKEVLQDLIYIN